MIIRSVRNVFQKYPYAASAFSYGSMCVGAEFSQQFLTKRVLNPQTPVEKIDTDVLKRYCVIGYGINPFLLHFWYRWLDKKYVGVAGKTVVKKVLLDQFWMTPILYIVFYPSMSYMEGKKDIFAELKTKFVPTFKVSCLVWLPAQTVNFLFIPNSFRVVYVGVCSFVWINILCWIKRKKVE